MAYGFDVSVSFGRFFPDGDFLGYDEQLKTRFDETLAKGKPEHKFFNEFRWAHVENMHHGTSFIADDWLPKRYVLHKRYSSLADLINLSAGIAVSAPLRDLIEKLEPGKHQLWPVELVYHSGEPYPGEYSMLRVLSQLDAFDKERSDPSCWERPVRVVKITDPKESHAHGIALSQSVVAGHHLWRGFFSAESGIAGFDFYVSDTLKLAIEGAGLRTMPFRQLKEV